MVWFETFTELDDDTATLMKFLGIAPKLGNIIGSIVIVLGFVTVGLAAYSISLNSSSKKLKKQYVSPLTK